ncbi:MAG: cytochrome C [Chitinophagaceae bacterium BSSC1]|nr:MAG: cytochrome C [Chitinophagaceae bacterium BSSC1]
MKRVLFGLTILLALYACGSQETANPSSNATDAAKPAENTGGYDPNRGEGKFKDVVVNPKLNATLAESGNKVYAVKCSSCHKTTEEKLVGPGWKGVTSRHSAAWILNFITNTDEMITKDPKAQAQLEICLVRMPNQNLSDDDAKSLYEFMRKVDGLQ